jgi:NAD(P)-dependent dehydrogenase (short-subunit alcohol dehydrogenase family)
MSGPAERCVVITGAGGRLGREFAFGFAATGARVVAVDLDGQAAVQTAALVAEAGGEAVAVTADVSDEAGTALMAASALEAFGTIDVLVNNAAVYAGPDRRAVR